MHACMRQGDLDADLNDPTPGRRVSWRGRLKLESIAALLRNATGHNPQPAAPRRRQSGDCNGRPVRLRIYR